MLGALGSTSGGGQSPLCAFCLVCLCELHPNCTRLNVILNEPFLGPGRVKNPILHEFGSGDRRVQSRNEVIKVLQAGIFPPYCWCDPLVRTLKWPV
jgi:hypothetical protein